MLTVYSEKHKLRDSKAEIFGGELVPPFECPRRAEIILERVKTQKLGPIISPNDYGLDPVLAVHDAGYVSFLETCYSEWKAKGFGGEAIALCWPTRTMNAPQIPRDIEGKLGYYALAAETAISGGTWEAALASKDVALTATDHVLKTKGAAFALCRPPGHHAAIDQFGGYCFLNNAAIAAQNALDQGLSKVALLDVDFHHGNGTQNIFYTRDDVFFLSLHGDPMDAFPHFLGHAEETGIGAGAGLTANYPMRPGTGYAAWKAALEDAIARIHAYKPDLLIISLGVDTFQNDPISFFKLTSDDFTDYGQLLGNMGLPTVYVMEGGYAVDEVGINTINVLQGHMAAQSAKP
ncbi:Acetylpolyamine aminohydrolase [Roseovarius litorisediminis]|uniref:Acetylpolyamine aminohydrolase n=1 Tax=Roseovarius litorisediminis TaxID=1312363 RepID=A0A1Y5T8N7_9RHOB|nr:histone deacetylase family protein [Roseovarius litorisediminis]SLN57899.1 Acetylpolyamine aminohydrolase [Roseovarius litorisediminis]